MKKFLFAAALIVGFVASQFIVTSRVEAADYYVGTWSTGYKAYLMTETISLERKDYMDYRCTVKAINGSDVLYIQYSFWEDRKYRLIEHFSNSQGFSGSFTVSDDNGYPIEYAIDNYVSEKYY